MEKNIEKKEISYKTTVRGLINGFISYGILITFIITMAVVFFNWFLNVLNYPHNWITTVTTSITSAFIVYFFILALCRLSTFDLFKKCKLNKDNTDTVVKKMKIFFIGCAIFSIITSSTVAIIKVSNSEIYLEQQSQDYYNSFKDDNIEIANSFIATLTQNLNEELTEFAFSLIIIEGTILFSCFYLITYQKKMISIYNN